VLNRLLNDLSLLVNFLHKIHHVLNIAVHLIGIFQKSDSFEVAHPVDKGLTLHIWINHQLSFEWFSIETVLVAE
jgi:hypothetical protein